MAPKHLFPLLLAVVLSVAASMRAEQFELQPTLEIYVGNDSALGPDTAGNPAAQGFHIWNSGASARQVAFAVYDLLDVAEGIGADFIDVNVSQVGYQYHSEVEVYAVLEEYEDLVTAAMTWNTAPGVKKTALGSPVELETSQLSDLLLTFTPVEAQRAHSDNSSKLAEFMSQDTNGKLVLMFAPPADGSRTTLLTLSVDQCGTFLHGDVTYNPTRASDPVPLDQQDDVYSATELSWTPGRDAATHDVYMSTDFDDVSEGQTTALVAEGLNQAVFAPSEPLAFGRTYYWRVDEVNPPLNPAVHVGPVWSFTVEPEFYPIVDVVADASSAEPAGSAVNVVNGSGLTDGLHDDALDAMWTSSTADSAPWIQFTFDRVYALGEMKIWNHNSEFESVTGFGVKELTVETSLDASTWVVVPEITELTQAPGTNEYAANNVFDLEGIEARYVRFLIDDNFGGAAVGLSEVQFTYRPTHARVPSPVTEATNVDLALELSWRAGRGAVEHQVYLGTDANLVASRDASLLLATTPLDKVHVDDLTLNTTYYWAVDAVGDEAVAAGELWSFSTPPYLTVEDFDDYDDTCNRIYWAWRDGAGYVAEPGCDVPAYEGNGSTAYVGYADPPYAERTITHESSLQSMPLEYDNSVSPFYAMAESQDYLLPSDWTGGQADTLNVHLKGYPAGLVEVSTDHLIISSSGGADILGTSDDFRYVYKPLSGNGSLVARVTSIDETDGWARTGVMIRASLEPDSPWVQMVVSARNGARLHQRLAAGGAVTTDTALLAASDPQRFVAAPAWIKIERQGNQFYGYYAMEESNPQWVPAAGNPQQLTMSNSAYMGLAVFSSNGAAITTAEVTNVAASAGGSWQVKTFGPEQPANSAEGVYLTVTDRSNRSKTVIHPNAAATQIANWTPWRISLSDLNGVSLSDVKRVTIGVGNPTNPVVGGAGTLFIDSIRLTAAGD